MNIRRRREKRVARAAFVRCDGLAVHAKRSMAKWMVDAMDRMAEQALTGGRGTMVVLNTWPPQSERAVFGVLKAEVQA